MNKTVFLLAGLGVMLTACTEVRVVVDPVRNLQLLSYQSEYVLAENATDPRTGQVYAAGSSILCGNLSTRVTFDAIWEGTADLVGAKLLGLESGVSRVVYTEPLGNLSTNGPVTFEFANAPGAIPLSVRGRGLTAQAIVVRPVNDLNVRGAAFLAIQARSADGSVSNVAESVQALPVADCTL